MKQKKKVHHSKPHQDSLACLDRRIQQTLVDAGSETYMQLMVDLFCLALHEEYGFGADRLTRLLTKVQELHNEHKECLQKSSVTSMGSFHRSVIDKELKEIFGDKAEPWSERYEWVEDDL